MVQTVLKLHKDLPKAKTAQTTYGRRLTAYGMRGRYSQCSSEPLAVSRKPIALPDALVHGLYGLTEEEIRIVNDHGNVESVPSATVLVNLEVTRTFPKYPSRSPLGAR